MNYLMGNIFLIYQNEQKALNFYTALVDTYFPTMFINDL